MVGPTPTRKWGTTPTGASPRWWGSGWWSRPGTTIRTCARFFPGNQNDSLSVGETVEILRARGYERIRLVMDRGMISKENVELARRNGYHLVGLVKGWDLQTVALASDGTEEEFERPEHVVATSRGSVYARALTTTLFGIPRVRVAVVVNPRRKAEEREGRDLALQELEGPVSKERLKELKQQLRVQNPRLRRKRGYVPGLLVKSAGRRGFHVDPDAVERDRSLDGRFLIFSTDLALSGPEMYRTYFARDGIEKVSGREGGTLPRPRTSPPSGPARRVCNDLLHGLASVELVGTNPPAKIPRDEPFGSLEPPRECGVGEVRDREIGP